jgi:hypothetical protein
MQLDGFNRFVWAAGLFGHVLLLGVLFVRHHAASFPAFTTYVAEKSVTTIVLFFVLNHSSSAAYRHFYWSLGLVDEVLQLLVFYELAAHVFCPTGVWARDVRRVFLGVISAGAVTTLLLAWLAQPTAHSLVRTFILRSNFFSAALMSELFVAMLVLSSTAGLPWNTHVARITQGLGTYSIVCVATDIILNSVSLSQHRLVDRELSHLRILVYLGCEAYWIVTLWQEAPAPRELPESMRAQIYALHKKVEYDLIRIRDWRNK